MSVTTPLTELADTEREQAIATVKTVTGRLADGDAEIARRKTAAADATARLAELAAEEAEIRRKLALAPLPADADQLVRQLESTLIGRQQAVAQAARAEDGLGAEERHRSALASALAAARRAVDTTTRTAERAQEDADQVEAWTVAARSQPVTEALDGARETLTAAVYTDARHRLDTLLGAKLVDLFVSRWHEADGREAEAGDRVARVRTARWALLAERGDPAAPSGALLTARSTYTAAVTALREVAEGATVRFGDALRRLAEVRGAAAPTQAEQQRMAELRPDAEAAAEKETEVLVAAAQLRTAEAALDAAVLAKIPDEPDIDPLTSAKVAAERAAADAARTVLAEKRTALGAVQPALDTWEAALPEPLKEQILAFLAADAALHQLGVDNLAETRIAEVTAARNGLVTALRTAAKATAAAGRLATEAAARSGDADAARAVAAARRAALVRGEA